MALEHLVLLPRSGLGNRMRAIASARRLSALSGARCSIVWDWPDYHALFDADPAIEVLAQTPAEIADSEGVMRLSLVDRGTLPADRRIPLDGPACILLTSGHCFGATDDPAPITELDLAPWLPRPAAGLRERVQEFRRRAFSGGRPVVGLHMRRTDNAAAIVRSPDRLFVRAAQEVCGAGGTIFLATDNATTERRMRARFGADIVTYPKACGPDRRWPREVGLADCMEDYVEFLLLADCDRVLGSSNSSYSMLAIALNGSPESRVILCDDAVSLLTGYVALALREHLGLWSGDREKLGRVILRALRRRWG